MSSPPTWCWTTTTTAIIGPLEGLAILSTLFRLWYRWSLGSMWWDDVWASVALLADVAGLVCVVLEQLTLAGRSHISIIGQWIGSCSFPTIMWAARLSVLTSVVRVSQPETVLKRVAICIGLAFGAMWICMIVQRLETCIHFSCNMTTAIAITQTTGSCLADTLLTVLPIKFLQDVKLRRKCRNLILTSFAASILINVVTIVHATLLFKPVTTETLIVAHIKTSLAVVVCNLLVIATFVYRVLHGGQACLVEHTFAKSRMELTTIEFNTAIWTPETSNGTSSACSSNTTRSSSWSFKDPSPMAPTLSAVVIGPSRTEPIQGDTRQEER